MEKFINRRGRRDQIETICLRHDSWRSLVSVYPVFYVLFCLLMRGAPTKNAEMIKVERDKIVPRRK